MKPKPIVKPERAARKGKPVPSWVSRSKDAMADVSGYYALRAAMLAKASAAGYARKRIDSCQDPMNVNAVY